MTIGAATPIAALEAGDEPLATAARHLADVEIRGQATIGGNSVRQASPEAPRGDLQAALIALGASRPLGRQGRRAVRADRGVPRDRSGRLVLDVSYDDTPRQTGYAAAWRPHAHHYTILAVAAAKRDGELRLAATGVGPRASGCDRRTTPLSGLELRDDALASAWYRSRLLPRLVEQALANLEEGR